MENTTLFNDHNDLVLLIYNICSPICVFLNGMAVYLIIFKSNSEMKTYRWHLLHYQIWASAIDIFLNCLFQPVPFLPLKAVAGYGFLITNLGISTFTSHWISNNLLSGLAISIVELFLYRHQCVVSRKLTRRQFCFCILFQFFLLSISTNIFYRLSYVDPSQWKEMLEKENPSAVEVLKVPNVYYMPPSLSLGIFNFITFISEVLVGGNVLSLSGLIVLALVWHIYYILRKDSQRLSIRTREMQRNFLVSLIWQVTVPVVFLLIPLVFACIRIFDGRLGLQILNNISSMMMSSYGILATLCLIYFNKPYRVFIFAMFKRKKTSPMPSLT